MKEPIIYPWMSCGHCNGYGIVTNTYTGEPDDCRKCGGSGLERARDMKGRFMKGSLPAPSKVNAR